MKGTRKKCKNQTQLPSKKDNEPKTSNKNAVRNIKREENITTYFPNDDNGQNFDSASTPEVHVPSPDDAALPHNTMKDKLLTEQIGKMKPTQKFSCVNGIEEKQPQKTTPPLKIILSSKKKSRKKFKVLTDYFPVRRSDRKPECTIKVEKEKEIEEAILSGKEDGFEIMEFLGKGRGVVANKTIQRGEFALEYHGDLISTEEAKQRERLYSKEENIGCYMYYFKYRNKQYCVDATKESGRLGRLVNHSQKGNLITKTFAVDDKPHLIFIACKDIQPGEELLYDYGDRRKESLQSHPWLSQ